MGILANENAIETGGYNIANSLRFQSVSSNWLTRSPASTPTSFTISVWVKRGSLGGTQCIMYSRHVPNASTGGNNGLYFSSDILYLSVNSADSGKSTSAVFRDPSAWYHIVANYNGSGTSAIYVNGVQQTTSGSNSGTNKLFNNVGTNAIGRYGDDSSGYFDGEMTEFYYIDGQVLTPSSFGQTDTLTGQWVAKKYTGTYGTNGFYLPFSNGTSTTTLGADSSGNSNNWTLTNFTRSAGVSDCWMIDVPSGNGSVVGGTQPSSNYCVLNPLKVVGGNTSASAGNLNASSSANSWGTRFTTVGMLTGKWYWEVQRTGNTYGAAAGMATEQLTAGDLTGTGAVGWAENGTFCNESGSYTGSSKTWVTNDILQFRYDADAGQLDINVNNGTWVTLVTGKSGRTWFPIAKCYGGSDALSVNFGQRSFAYTPPTGFKALCTANLPAATIKKGNQYMDATLYTGNTTTVTVTNSGSFQPDLVWIKDRSQVASHVLTDAVRGATQQLFSNLTNAEQTNSVYVTAFNSNGFTVGVGNTGTGVVNNNGDSFVAWQWDAGSSTVTNTNGSISSQVRANPTCGVSVVTYTGTGANATVGHGLGVAPKMVIVKYRNAVANWLVYHGSLANTQYLLLNSTNAVATGADVWNSTTPTSSVFSLGTNASVNQSTGTYVAYCFSEIAGFSKFGSYTGNSNADGAFVYTGFRPRYVMIKNAGLADNWCIYDTARNTYNVTNSFLIAQGANAEQTGLEIDILSNGFKARTTNDNVNSSSYSYIYMAFAENPFAQANAR